MADRVSKISLLRNLGGKTEQWLNEIGVFDREDLERLGSVEIYRLLRKRGHPASLNLVYAIEGALADLDWRYLPAELKADLKNAISKI